MPKDHRLPHASAEGEMYHCISRCVRQAYLCGWDARRDRCLEHRRLWVRDRLGELVSQFAVDVYTYTVMPDQLHVVLAMDPARGHGWTDVEVARRWLMIFPGPGGQPDLPPENSAVFALCREPARLALCRDRLTDISWFMRCLHQPIARRANREDNCTGRFWEARHKCQPIKDARSLLNCPVCRPSSSPQVTSSACITRR